MILYTFVCRGCDNEFTSTSRIPPVCSGCGQTMKRVFGFNSPRPLEPHWNPTTGQYVSSDKEFRTQLAELSHRSDENLGATIAMAHHFEPVDPSTPEAYGVTEEGMDVTRRAKRDSGQDPATKRIIV